MKIVVGGTGFIRLKLVKKLREHGQEVVAGAPISGVNTLTGEGLAHAVKGASVVVDLTNSPSREFQWRRSASASGCVSTASVSGCASV
jgi:hypothetical protein